MKKNIFTSVLVFTCVLFSKPLLAAPILGEQLFYTGGDVTLEILQPSASYTSDLGLYLFTNSGPLINLGQNHEVGKIVDFNPLSLGVNIGDELIFGIDVLNTGYTYFTGAAARNPDGLMHAVVDDLGAGEFIVGFEDIFGGGDKDYDDHQFKFSGGLNIQEVPEPAPAIMLLAGFLALGIKRRLS